jgi:hypothetical protein
LAAPPNPDPDKSRAWDRDSRGGRVDGQRSGAVRPGEFDEKEREQESRWEGAKNRPGWMPEGLRHAEDQVQSAQREQEHLSAELDRRGRWSKRRNGERYGEYADEPHPSFRGLRVATSVEEQGREGDHRK